ncbi:hypothetical protein CTI12_AA322330 [Artemisia annua]|uniref:Uncharacterized protein n=1 Tax=Artemisia annua TaxID=35608 RepID=A0A2U1MFR8_ARTAN|nr:hypothetical protein CTI12_AA322330 [Artemisia annua]
MNEVNMKVNTMLVKKVKRIQEKYKKLKKERKANIIDSAGSSDFEDLDMGDCSHHERQTETNIQGTHPQVVEQDKGGGLDESANKETGTGGLQEGTVTVGKYEIAKAAEEQSSSKISNQVPVESDEQIALRLQNMLAMIAADPVLKAKYNELQSNCSLSKDEKGKILAEFINRRNQQVTFDQFIKPFKKGENQKKKTASKPTTQPTLDYMKKYLFKNERYTRAELSGKGKEEIVRFYNAA